MIKEIQRKRIMCLTIACLCFVVLMIVTIIPAKQVNAKVSGFWKYKDYKDGISILGYTGGESVITIPDTIEEKEVKEIAESAFEDNKYIETVVLPKTLTSIDSYSFYNCSNLKEVKGLEHVNNMEKAAFKNCTSLDNVVIGAESVEKEAFKNCSSLKNLTFTTNVKYIRNTAFQECISLQSLTIPDSVLELGNIDKLDELYEDSEYLYEYFGNDSWTNYSPYHYNYYYGDGYYYDDYYSIGYYDDSYYGDYFNDDYDNYGCFSGCTSLTDVVIGNNVEYIGKACFINCTSLKNINIPDSVKYIARRCFRGCISLENISIPYKIKNISLEMFSGCASLKSVQLPQGLLCIEEEAFFGTAIKNLVLPNKVLKIGFRAFAGIDDLNITLPNSIYYIYKAFDNTYYYDDYYYDDDEFQRIININCYPNSYVSSYASDNNIPYTILSDRPCTQFSFDKATMYLSEGDRNYISYTINPSDTTDYIKWESSDDSIASVNPIGEVLAKKKGSVTIFATTTSGTRTSFNLVVNNKPDKILFSEKEKFIKVSEKFTLQPTAFDNTGERTDVLIEYISSDESIAIVDDAGNVTGLKVGEATITASAGDLSASYIVKVVDADTPVKISFLNSKVNLIEDDTLTLLPTVLNIDDEVIISGKVMYTSSDEGVAKIDSEGNITGLSAGTVNITASVENISASVKVTVTGKINNIDVKKNGKKLKIKTIVGANVVVKAKKEVLGKKTVKVKTNSNGVANVTFKKKIGKTKVSITVSKPGYITKTIIK